MATKKQMTETINRVDIIEDSMLKMEEHIVMLKEMITMQNRYIDNMNTLMLQMLQNKTPSLKDEHLEKREDIVEKQVVDVHEEVPVKKAARKGCPHLVLSRRVT
jgi:non-homologous end joining protein Ku